MPTRRRSTETFVSVTGAHDTDLSRLEARLLQVEQSIASLDERLRSLEAAGVVAPDAALLAGAGASLEATGNTEAGRVVDLTGVLSLVGRTFMVFGGAFLLRALTIQGACPVVAASWWACSMRWCGWWLPTAPPRKGIALARSSTACPAWRLDCRCSGRLRRGSDSSMAR